MNALITVFYDWSRIIAGYFTLLAPLAVRVVVGWVFLWSGWEKLQVLPRMIENFRSWGIPAPEILTPFVSGVEFVGWPPAAARPADALRRGADDDRHARGDRRGQVRSDRFPRNAARLRASLLFRHVRLARYRGVWPDFTRPSSLKAFRPDRLAAGYGA
jgi:DoxX